MSYAIIDIQGFIINKKHFFTKELAILKNDRIAHFIFKQPFQFKHLPEEYKKPVMWLIHNHHCIKWETGFVQPWKLKSILTTLTNDIEKIYVKGGEKAKIIGKYIRPSKIIEFPEHPALIPDEPDCMFHEINKCYCSLKNVKFLQKTFQHVIDNPAQLDMDYSDEESIVL
ncbi:hypothetical protein WA026_014139 [Henosepilachna vigintioctopunctata]|uniref:Uncharacterized protein n=1 Tax=Henosepilachna vigintioctopunctata TaxID=420089 RepID=A0AAW1TTJ9_9CUCU